MRRVKNQMIGVEASVTMGELRSMKVYIMGEVAHPGSYAVSSLATITTPSSPAAHQGKRFAQDDPAQAFRQTRRGDGPVQPFDEGR
jgi:uncharacterized Zn-binding protein involved in type VI secretion